MSNEGRPAFPMLTDRVRINRRAWFLVVAVIIALLPFVIQDSYWRTNLVVCAINIMLAIGLDFILGYAGQLNLGHSAFYGIGAYASTLLVMKLGVPFWMAFVLGMVLSGAAGMALSIFAVRLRGHYLAIASLGFAVIVHLMHNDGKSERGNCKGMAAQANREERQGHAGGAGQYDAEDERHPEWHAELHNEQRGGIGTDAVERRVTEVKLTCISENEIKADGQHDVDGANDEVRAPIRV